MDEHEQRRACKLQLWFAVAEGENTVNLLAVDDKNEPEQSGIMVLRSFNRFWHLPKRTRPANAQ
jgi:hypothetical protein